MNLLNRPRRRIGPLDIYFGALSGQELWDAEGVFFGGLQLSNGTFKTTWPHRLDDVNHLVAPLLPRGRRLEIMDVAVSSGIATAEWSEHLHTNGIDHCVVAGDLAVEGRLMTLGCHAAILWQDDGHPLVLQLGYRSAYLIRGRVGISLISSALRWTYPLVQRSCTLTADSRPKPWRIRLHSVRLVSRRLATANIAVITDDICQAGTFSARFDVCRAANILHRGYFSEAMIRRMGSNLLQRVRDGGLLVVCRTHDDDGVRLNRASIVRRDGDSAEVVARLNGGSDVEQLLLGGAGPPEHTPPSPARRLTSVSGTQ